MNQSASEEERLKDFSFVQEEDHVDHGKKRQMNILLASNVDQKNKSTPLCFQTDFFCFLFLSITLLSAVCGFA